MTSSLGSKLSRKLVPRKSFHPSQADCVNAIVRSRLALTTDEALRQWVYERACSTFPIQVYWDFMGTYFPYAGVSQPGDFLSDEDNMEINLSRYVLTQIPAGIRAEFDVRCEADAFLLRATATFTVKKDGRVWETPLELEPDPTGRFEMCTKVPEVFVAQLCVVV